jgi:predicted O-linked N-acetylglucosamine transferase (SPINDLY family)
MLANRASIHLALADYAAAENDAGEATRRDAQSFGAWFNLGLALRGQHRSAPAASAFARASALRPADARALLEWFSAAAASGQPFGMAERTRRALPSLAQLREFALQTATLLEHRGFANQALALLAQLRSELPQDAETAFRCDLEMRYRQASLLDYQQRPFEALAQADAVLAALPTHRSARFLRASLLGERGDTQAALAEYRRLLEQVPDDAHAGSAYLIALQHDPDASAESIAQAHRDWAARHAPLIAPRRLPERPHADPERALRIGWLSPRFCAGLVPTFFAAELECLERRGMTHVLYDSGGIDDEATARFRAAADEWRRVDALDDAALCAQIRADRIDVLVELSGHSPGNRLRALASRPAPVQVTWLDYFHSTGLAAIDVLLSDAVLSPPQFAQHYSERVSILRSGRLCYAPPPDAPDLIERSTGPVRFGCFNRLNKINDAVLRTWSHILADVPDSCLRLKARAFDGVGMREHFLARAAAAGIDAARIEFFGYGSHRDTLDAYNTIDIALDPFPFSGCATSCDALWMGVPVITRIGETMVSRQSASLLTALDLTDLIAADDDDYVHRAIALARDARRRRQLHTPLRERMRAGLCDPQRHARELTDALREAWRNWCNGAWAGNEDA